MSRANKGHSDYMASGTPVIFRVRDIIDFHGLFFEVAEDYWSVRLPSFSLDDELWGIYVGETQKFGPGNRYSEAMIISNFNPMIENIERAYQGWANYRVSPLALQIPEPSDLAEMPKWMVDISNTIVGKADE